MEHVSYLQTPDYKIDKKWLKVLVVNVVMVLSQRDWSMNNMQYIWNFSASFESWNNHEVPQVSPRDTSIGMIVGGN